MRQRRLPAALALALPFLLAFATPARAQVASPVERGVWSVTPLLSFTFGGDADSASLGAGAAVSYDFTERLSVEGELAYVFDLAGDDEIIDWAVTSFGANVLYHFPTEYLALPYATAGIGFARSSFNLETGPDGEPLALLDSGSTEVGFNLGGGVKLPLTDRLVARADARYFKYNDAAPDGFRIYGGLTFKLRR